MSRHKSVNVMFNSEEHEEVKGRTKGKASSRA